MTREDLFQPRAKYLEGGWDCTSRRPCPRCAISTPEDPTERLPGKKFHELTNEEIAALVDAAAEAVRRNNERHGVACPV